MDPDTNAPLSEDPLLAALANVSFTSTPSPADPATAVVVPTEYDPEHAAIHAALQAGAIPTFADEPQTAPTPMAVPIDVEAERAAYAAFVAFLKAHKAPGTSITVADPDLFTSAFD